MGNVRQHLQSIVDVAQARKRNTTDENTLHDLQLIVGSTKMIASALGVDLCEVTAITAHEVELAAARGNDGTQGDCG